MFTSAREKLEALLLLAGLAGLAGCSDLWGFTLREDAHNCTTAAGQCAEGEVCNSITEACEPGLVVDAVAPPRGPSSGGVPLRIIGRGFLPGTTVALGSPGRVAEPLMVVSETEIAAALPPWPGGCGPFAIEVSRPGGGRARRDGLFSYFPQSLSFAAAQPVGVGASSFVVYVLAHDLDQDGLPDIVSAGYDSGGIDVFMNRGRGTMHALPHIATGANPYFLAVGDVDRNGFADLAVANLQGGTVSILLGMGKGQFNGPVNLANPGPESVHFLDADSDGKLDVAVLTNAASLRLFKGDGSGKFTFVSEVKIDAGQALSAAADVDHDGRLDLIVNSSTGAALAVHRNQGDGTFQRVSLNSLTSTAPSCTVADVNHDGHPDLIAAEYAAGLTSIFIGRGDGTFMPKQSYPSFGGSRVVAAADLNCDGHIDLAVSHLGSQQVVVMLGRGDGTFDVLGQTASLSRGTSALGLAIADLDGDRLPELIIGADGTASSVQAAQNTAQ